MSNTSYWLYQRYVKYGDQDWIPVYPVEYAISGNTGQPPVVKQQDDPNCGFCPAEYRWQAVPISEDYICSGGNKYYKEVYQVSTDCGFNWENTSSARTGSLYESGSSDCIEYRWVNMDISTDYICDECPELKLKATYSDSTTYYVECNSSTTLSSTEVRGHSTTFSSMTSAEIGDCVSEIGHWYEGGAFRDCISLSSVTIPDSVTSISSDAFRDCTSLTSITIPDSVTYIGSYAFNSCGLINVDIPSSVTIINNNAFAGCSYLTSCTISDNVTEILGYTFQLCTRLTSITIPDSVTSIGEHAFSFCFNMTSCTIGSGITSIGIQAFSYCNSLESITINAITPPTLGDDAFGYTNNCPIYVPAASVSAYQSASGWSTYVSRIQAIT